MNSTLFFSFLAATLVIAATPGPSVALASGQAIHHGRKAALVATLGDALGTVVHIVVAVLGLEILIRSAASVLPALQVVGGGYIVFLAVRALRAPGAADTETPARPALRSAFLSGFLACVSNPKAIVFFIALFPGFIDPAHDVVLQSTLYGVTFVVVDGAFILGYALLARAVARSRTGSRFNMEKIGGVGLLAVGLWLAARGILAR